MPTLREILEGGPCWIQEHPSILTSVEDLVEVVSGQDKYETRSINSQLLFARPEGRDTL
jgi:hypothetical protein